MFDKYYELIMRTGRQHPRLRYLLVLPLALVFAGAWVQETVSKARGLTLKQVATVAMCACMIFVMTPALPGGGAFATENETPVGNSHTHDDTWQAVSMGTTYIKIGDTEQKSNALTAGNYYLTGDLSLTSPLYIVDGSSNSGMVNLCLNGHSITNSSTETGSSGAGVYMKDESKLTVVNCVSHIVTISGKSYGIYIYDDASLYIKAGNIKGETYGLYNSKPSYSQIYLSGTPSITGGTAGIYNSGSSSKIFANDGAESAPTPYIGDSKILLKYSSLFHGNTAVYNVSESNKDKFTLVSDSALSNYELAYVGASLEIQGKPQTLTWYDEDGTLLTGENYPAFAPYGSDFSTYSLPSAPEKANKIFLGWLYRKTGNSSWSSGYRSGVRIDSPYDFKADYIDSFSGSGTEADPYIIATATDLQKLATVVNRGISTHNNSNVYYKLSYNIDLSTVCGENKGSWMPVGNSSNSFKANFDGANHTIFNLYINSYSRYQGLFGYIDGGTVKDLTLTGKVSGGENCGALAGKIFSNSTITNVNESGVTVTPYGYTTDSNQTMAYKKESYSNTIDVKGNWIKTTFSDMGYGIASQNMNSATITSNAYFINDGKYLRLSYSVTAGDTAVTGGKLAVHADTMIGDNDKADLEVIQDSSGKVIGLKMVDTHTSSCTSQNAQFNLYFDGTGGVTPVTTYWFGYFSNRHDNCFVPLNDNTKSSSGTYTQGNGVYTKLSGVDSGFAVSWQDINLEAKESKTFSFILGVGEKADPPVWNSGSAVSLTLAADVSQNDRLVDVSAKVQDAAGLIDTLYYSVNGGEGNALGSVTADGSTMKTVTSQLNLSNYANGEYKFSFWVVNSKGAASSSVERTITITESGIDGLDTVGSHTHEWNMNGWSTNETHHWHECTAAGCDLTDNSQKQSYGAHVYDNNTDTTCNTCGYTRTIASDDYTVNGDVKNHDNRIAANVTVNLKKGNKVIATTTTDSNGQYAFHAPSGVYNIVAERSGVTMTVLVTVGNSDVTVDTITMPNGAINSILNVTGDNTPDISVGGLNGEAQHVKNSEGSATTVTVTMSVESKTESSADNANAIKGVASGKNLEYLDIKVEKQINGTSAVPMSTTTTLMEIVIPFDKTGKSGITVYRYHDGSASTMAANPSEGEEGYTLGDTTITIYAKKFSTYAIGYTEDSGTPDPPGRPTGPSVPAPQKPTISTDVGTDVTLSADGITAEIKVKDSYELEDVTVNGISKGKVTKLTGLKTGDKVIVTTKKTLAASDAARIEQAQSTKLVARSRTTTLHGKTAVKVYWYAENGEDITKIYDGYVVYRSTKRSGGYGTKPFFHTKKTTYINNLDLERGNRYYYKVYGYVEVSGQRYYSDQSLKAWRTIK